MLPVTSMGGVIDKVIANKGKGRIIFRVDSLLHFTQEPETLPVSL